MIFICIKPLYLKVPLWLPLSISFLVIIQIPLSKAHLSGGCVSVSSCLHAFHCSLRPVSPSSFHVSPILSSLQKGHSGSKMLKDANLIPETDLQAPLTFQITLTAHYR